MQKQELITEIKKYITSNKAKGALAEMDYKKNFPNLLDGFWVISQTGDRFTKPIKATVIIGTEFNACRAQWESYSGLLEGTVNIIALKVGKEWKINRYKEVYGGGKTWIEENNFFDNFLGKVLHKRYISPVYNKEDWEESITERFNEQSEQDLTQLLLKEEFIYTYLRSSKRAIFSAHDVDAVSIAPDGTPQVVEIKEKFPMETAIGIDMSKFMMFSFFGNRGVYAIREMDREDRTQFKRYCYVTYSDIIKHTDWKVIYGGKSMSSQTEKAVQTHTALIPYALFKEFRRS